MKWFYLIYLMPLIPIVFAFWFLWWCTRDDKRWLERMRDEYDSFKDAERPFIEQK